MGVPERAFRSIDALYQCLGRSSTGLVNACHGKDIGDVDLGSLQVFDPLCQPIERFQEFSDRFFPDVDAECFPSVRGEIETVHKNPFLTTPLGAVGADATGPAEKTLAFRSRLLDGNALRQIPRLVDIATSQQGDVVCQQLQRNDAENRL